MTEYSNGGLAGWQTMLCEEVGNGTIRRALLPQLDDDILRGEQILEFLRTARREFFDRFSNCCWIKGGHKWECCECEPGNWSVEKWKRRCGDVDDSLPVEIRGQCWFVEGLWAWTIHACGLSADIVYTLPIPGC
ncbi:MAG: hypothetical protein ABSA69_11070, partial [Verrucomicrobiota bacterium]